MIAGIKNGRRANLSFSDQQFGCSFCAEIRNVYDALETPTPLGHGVMGGFLDLSETGSIKIRSVWRKMMFASDALPSSVALTLVCPRSTASFQSRSGGKPEHRFSVRRRALKRRLKDAGKGLVQLINPPDGLVDGREVGAAVAPSARMTRTILNRESAASLALNHDKLVKPNRHAFVHRFALRETA